MLAIAALSKTPLGGISLSLGSLALQAFLLQQWYGGLSWNYPSWSISTEAEAYVFFVFAAVLLVTGRYPHLISACCVAILATMCIANGGSLNLFEGFRALLRALSKFSLAALLYRAHCADPQFLRKWAAVLAVLLVGLGGCDSDGFRDCVRFRMPHLLCRRRYGCRRPAAKLPPLDCARRLVVFNLSIARARPLRSHGRVCRERLFHQQSRLVERKIADLGDGPRSCGSIGCPVPIF